VVDGQKVPIRLTRLRSPENREQRLDSYELFQRSAPLEQSGWDKMMRGLSTRNYGALGMEETLTVHRLRVAAKLRRTQFH
jgi:hypothetical protein